MPTRASLLQLGHPLEIVSSMMAVWQSKSPGHEPPVGTSHSPCPQTYPSSFAGPQYRLWEAWKSMPLYSWTLLEVPGYPGTWVAWETLRRYNEEEAALLSLLSPQRHWLREGVRGCFSGFCSWRTREKSWVQASSPGRCPAVKAAHGTLGLLSTGYPSTPCSFLPPSCP